MTTTRPLLPAKTSARDLELHKALTIHLGRLQPREFAEFGIALQSLIVTRMLYEHKDPFTLLKALGDKTRAQNIYTAVESSFLRNDPMLNSVRELYSDKALVEAVETFKDHKIIPNAYVLNKLDENFGVDFREYAEQLGKLYKDISYLPKSTPLQEEATNQACYVEMTKANLSQEKIAAFCAKAREAALQKNNGRGIR